MNKKELKTFVILDIIEFILAIIGMFVFTFVFAVVDTNQRYLFLICDLYVILVFLKNWDSIGEYFKNNGIRKSKVERMNLEKLSKIKF